MTDFLFAKNNFSIGSLLEKLDIKTNDALTPKDKELRRCLAEGFVSSWPSFFLFSIGCWMAAIVFGDGGLAFISANFPSEGESRYTLFLSSLMGALAIAIAYLIFISFKGYLPRMLSVSTALGSEYLIVMAIAGEGYSYLWAVIVAFVLLITLSKLFTDATHQIGLSAIFCTILTLFAVSYTPTYTEPFIIIVTLPIALFAIFYPMKGLDLRPLGMIFLLAPLAANIYITFNSSVDVFGLSDTIARIIYMTFYAWMMYLSAPTMSPMAKKFILVTFTPIVVISLLTSSGIAASFFIIFIAYLLQSRLVMAVGIGTNIIFTVLFYFDLAIPTTYKAILLLLSGSLVLLVRFILAKNLKHNPAKEELQ